ncbi:hypothetical protein PN36_15640 [Candidatus Thiomargarita nelsonii]|uniref:Uncharacterized protein n=1 Tax=Candidatus Thiomargarita nelsonii TaxID=1003181 RepID=A0A0A6PC57_9GAMM|nr:hypothetical protein PN36_15640 [Candidatus Thiomargarita nelsonii]
MPIAIVANQDNAKDYEIAEWLKHQLPTEHKPSSYTIAQQISVPDEFLYRLDNFFAPLPEHWEEVKKWDSVGYALGTAIGQSLANTVNIKQMLIAYSLFETQAVGHYALEYSWLEILPTTTHQQTWLNEIHNATKELSSNPIDCFFKTEREIATAQLAEWEQTTELSKTWHQYPIELGCFSHLIEMLDLVRQLDKTHYLTILDTLTYPILVRNALKNYKITQDREEILSLLANANTVLDNNGKWNKRTVAPLLAEMIVSHAHRLVESLKRLPDSFQQLREQEIPDWFNKAFGVLLTRQDGNVIGIKWLIELIERYQSEIWRSGETEWSITVTAIECLSKCLAEKDYRLKETDAEEIKRHGLSKFLAATLIAEKKTTLSESEDLWQWFQKLLLTEDEGIKNHFDSGQLTGRWVYYQPANLLANSNENPVKQWQQTWNKLQEQRNCAMHYIKDRNALASSQFLMQTGICTLDWLLDYQKDELARELWQVLYDALRETWLTQRNDINNVWPRLIGFLFAREHKIFEPQDTYLTKILPQHLKPLWGNSDLLTLVSLNLNQNGLSPQKLIEAFQAIGIDILANIKTNNLWEKVTNKSFHMTDEVNTLLNSLIYLPT